MAKNLRARLITESVSMFEEDGGVHHLNMRELARRCEVSHAAPYRHFADVDELVRAVAEQGFELLDEDNERLLEEHQDTPPASQYVALGVHYVDWALEHRGYAYAIAEAGPLFVDREGTGRPLPGALARQVELIKQAQATGWRDSTHPELLALAGWIYAQGVVRVMLSGELSRLGEGVAAAKALIREAANVPTSEAEIVRMMHRSEPAPRESDAAQALLGATAELIAQDGLAAFSLREASRRGGVSPSAPAKLFGDREGTLRALALEGYQRLDKHLANALGDEVDPGTSVRSIAKAYSTFAHEYPGHAGVMWRSDLFPAGERPPGWSDAAALIRLREACQAWLDERGAETPTAEALAFAALALAHGTASLWLEGVTPQEFDQLDLAELAELAHEALAQERDLAAAEPD